MHVEPFAVLDQECQSLAGLRVVRAMQQVAAARDECAWDPNPGDAQLVVKTEVPMHARTYP